MKREHGDVDTDLAVMDISKKNSATFYMCEECNSVFLTQDSLAVHILVQHMNQPHDLKVNIVVRWTAIGVLLAHIASITPTLN